MTVILGWLATRKQRYLAFPLILGVAGGNFAALLMPCFLAGALIPVLVGRIVPKHQRVTVLLILSAVWLYISYSHLADDRSLIAALFRSGTLGMSSHDYPDRVMPWAGVLAYLLTFVPVSLKQNLWEGRVKLSTWQQLEVEWAADTLKVLGFGLLISMLAYPASAKLSSWSPTLILWCAQPLYIFLERVARRVCRFYKEEFTVLTLGCFLVVVVVNSWVILTTGMNYILLPLVVTVNTFALWLRIRQRVGGAAGAFFGCLGVHIISCFGVGLCLGQDSRWILYSIALGAYVLVSLGFALASPKVQQLGPTGLLAYTLTNTMAPLYLPLKQLDGKGPNYDL